MMASSAATRCRPADRESSPSRPPPGSRRRRQFARVGAACDAPHADHREAAIAAATARTWATAIGRTAGPERPPCPARCPACRVAGSIALAFSVLISETASAPLSSAATATAAGSATLGVSFTISGFAVSGRSASSSAAVSSGCSPTISPDWTLGQETLSSIAATSSRSRDRLDEPRELLAARRHHRDDQRHRQLGQLRQVLRQNPPRPRFGRPIELIIPAGVSHIRCGSLPAAGLERDRLRDEGGERELLQQRVAVDPPGGDRVEVP